MSVARYMCMHTCFPLHGLASDTDSYVAVSYGLCHAVLNIS